VRSGATPCAFAQVKGKAFPWDSPGVNRSGRSIDGADARAGSSSLTAGALAAETWLRARGATPTAFRWHVEVTLEATSKTARNQSLDNTQLRLEIYSDEWGVYFAHAGRASWVRVTDVAFVHGRDDFGLLHVLPPLKDVGQLMRHLERAHGVRFRFDRPVVKTNLEDVEPLVRAWVTST
jgi:hypothetical protein